MGFHKQNEHHLNIICLDFLKYPLEEDSAYSNPFTMLVIFHGDPSGSASGSYCIFTRISVMTNEGEFCRCCRR